LTDGIGELSAFPIYIDDSPTLTPIELRARARKMVLDRGCGLVIVDYLQLMHLPESKHDRAREVDAISRGLKHLAKELDVPVMGLSQFNRGADEGNEIPHMSHLKESSGIEQNADNVWVLHRKRGKDQTRVNQAVVSVQKSRHGPTGLIDLYFESKVATFHSVTKYADEYETENIY
jgi:replicative DNA helicase